jgi:outer membrane protein assembly factor BamB
MKLRAALALLALLTALEPRAAGQSAASFDWPQWRGPNRDGVSKETGLLKQWPRTGPPVAWTAQNLGNGFGSLAVQGDRIYVQGLRNRQSVVSALNRATGALVWTKPIGSGGENDRGSGPRGTPTIDGDRAYVLTETGDLASLRVADGSVVWQRNILTDFRGRNISWLVSESPLVDGNLVIVTPGGRGAGMAALDKLTGKTVWTSADLNDAAGYASPIVADVQGVRTVMTMTSQAGVGVRESDGLLMWRNGQAANGTANISTPVYADCKEFFTSAYGAGGVLLGLSVISGTVRAQEVYFTRNMQNHHGGVVLVGRHLYGFNNAVLACLDFATGQSVWRDRSVGKGSLVYADGHLYLLSEDNVVGLAEATPDGYREKGRFPIADQGWNSWAHPVVAGGRLYIRNQQTLTSYDVRAR